MWSQTPVAPASDVGGIQDRRLLELDRWSSQSVSFRFNDRLCLKDTSHNMTKQDSQSRNRCVYLHTLIHKAQLSIHTYKEILVVSLNRTFIPSKINSASVNQAENVVLTLKSHKSES